MMNLSLPALNIKYPYGEMIINRAKTIETRTYRLPESYLNQDILLVETGRPDFTSKTMVLGIVRFTECFEYGSISEFRKQEKLHLVKMGTVWDWSDKPKWGWKVQVLNAFPEPTRPRGPRGIRFTKKLSVTF